MAASTGMTTSGRNRLASAEQSRLVPVAEKLFLVDLFSGISAAGRALELLGICPAGHLGAEVDPVAIHVASRNFPAMRWLGDIRAATAAKVKELTDEFRSNL